MRFALSLDESLCVAGCGGVYCSPVTGVQAGVQPCALLCSVASRPMPAHPLCLPGILPVNCPCPFDLHTGFMVSIGTPFSFLKPLLRFLQQPSFDAMLRSDFLLFS